MLLLTTRHVSVRKTRKHALWAHLGINLKSFLLYLYLDRPMAIMNTTHEPGACLNIKIRLMGIGIFHCGDKMVVRPSYLHHGKSLYP
jgi:hypothetical protein